MAEVMQLINKLSPSLDKKLHKIYNMFTGNDRIERVTSAYIHYYTYYTQCKQNLQFDVLGGLTACAMQRENRNHKVGIITGL